MACLRPHSWDNPRSLNSWSSHLWQCCPQKQNPEEVRRAVMALPILDRWSQDMHVSRNTNRMSWLPRPPAHPQCQRRQRSLAGSVWDSDGDGVLPGTLHVTDDSEVSRIIKQAQKTTCGWWGVRKVSAYGLNFLCSTSVFKHKGEMCLG